MAGDGFDLTVGATRFQKFNGRILTQAVKGVFLFVTFQPEELKFTLPVSLETILAKRLTRRGAGDTVRPKQSRCDDCFASAFCDSQFSL